MQQKVRERVGDGDKNIFCGAVMGSSICSRGILYFRIRRLTASVNETIVKQQAQLSLKPRDAGWFVKLLRYGRTFCQNT